MSIIRRALVVPAVAALVVSLSACDADEVGAAAVIGDYRVTVTELQQQTRDVMDLDGSQVDETSDLTELQSILLEREVRHQVLTAMAVDHDVVVTDADVDEYIEETLAPQAPDGDITELLGQFGYTEETLRIGVHDELAAGELSSALGDDPGAFADEFNATADELGVAINPRYGTWGDDLALERTSGSISEPFDVEQPVPSQ
ncbi:MAG: SurA N-terminal domain-containing protein [Jiangellaceae bacterium]